ncbi:hypothetical protein HID58_057794 [Brassica napus]|uniref:Uncharacterized protein n=1 Tax=Brassica napus TaxID=3708 RepID=A0ABQ7XHE7_BRANA|nr:hypothetical protein HID58_057794 [Brassica napus]
MRSSNDEVAVKQCPFFSFPLSTPKIFPALHLAAEPRKDSATANWAAALRQWRLLYLLWTGHESSEGSAGSVNMVLILKQKVKHLQHKLEEARADLNAKEARIQELEYSKIESEFEGIFQGKIEAEIKHLVPTKRCLSK